MPSLVIGRPGSGGRRPDRYMDRRGGRCIVSGSTTCAGDVHASLAPSIAGMGLSHGVRRWITSGERNRCRCVEI